MEKFSNPVYEEGTSMECTQEILHEGTFTTFPNHPDTRHDVSSPEIDVSSYQHFASMTLTMPQSSPFLPSRPEFPPFSVEHLCAATPYDGGDFMTYPERQGWVVHHQDEQCHPLCPPGICFEGIEADILSRGDHYRAHGPMPPMFSRADGSPITSASKAAFIQSWLFFGTLHEVSNMCGLSIDIQTEFVVDDGRAVSTAPLNGLAGRWFMSLNSSTVGNTVFMERVLAITRQMSLLLTREVLVRPGVGPRFRYTPEQARVLLSVDVVLRVLALHLLLHVNSPRFSAAADGCWDAGRISTVVDLVGRPREGNWDLAGHGASDDGRASRGWCESEVASFEFSGSDAYRFVAVLERPPLRDHSSCDDMTCVAYQVDEAVYRTAHAATVPECTCEFAGVPAEDLVRQLARDMVPAVVIGEDLEMRVVDSSAHPYAAFSHVWADGLGNPRRNALPRCQLRRLRDYAISLRRAHGGPLAAETDVVVWIDTLCVPVEPDLKEYRNKAIRLMGKTFRAAHAVLVLDRELEILVAAETSFLELGIQILCSGWMKRLWTLEEGTFALSAMDASPPSLLDHDSSGPDSEEEILPRLVPRLYFQMCDGPFYLWKYATARGTFRAEAKLVLLDQDLIEEFCLRVPAQRPGTRGETTDWWGEGGRCGRDAFRALARRSTSRAEDAPVCAASIFGLDPGAILAAPPHERAAALYSLLPSVPEGVLWAADVLVEKLAVAPYRWAPASLAAVPDEFLVMSDRELECDGRGVHVRCAGFILDPCTGSSLGELLEQGTCILKSSSSTETNSPGPSFGEIRRQFGHECSASDTEELSEEGSESSGAEGPLELKPIPARARVAVMLKPRELGESDIGLPNAAIVLIESHCNTRGPGDLGTDVEIVGTIVGYRYFSVTRSPDSAVSEQGDRATRVILCTHMAEDQRWCIT